MVVSQHSLNQQLNRSLKNIFNPQQLESCRQKLQFIEPKPGELCWHSQTSESGVYFIVEGKARLLDEDNNLIVSISEGWFGQISLFPSANLQSYLETILKNQTTFIIAHRLSTVRNADLILVMDRGLLVESGTHQELMEKKGQYYYLNQQQLTINN